MARSKALAVKASDTDRDIAVLVAGEGYSYARAWRAVHGADDDQASEVKAIAACRARITPLVAELQAKALDAAIETASLSRAQLVDQIRQDREFAIATGNASAALAASKLLAQMSGLLLPDNVQVSVDAASLLEAVERRARGEG